ncbi:MAG: TrkH family potassium uptake protein [Candidatus Tenebribacter burtonii]|jgi:trk system potassium uptake protein TrkH|nr:TrkH family potassium uptake protein [Candidatus Tenebribacter burtonii]
MIESKPDKVQKFAIVILTLFAIVNIELLFLKLIKIDSSVISLYTNISIIFLTFYISYRLLINGVTVQRLLNLLPDIIFIFIGLLIKDSERVFQFYLIGRQAFSLLNLRILSDTKGTFIDNLSDNPPVLVMLTFFLAIFIGALLLMLPVATSPGEETSLLGALFTSTSATCVTGLIVYDTGMHFTLFGQIIILTLIQIGGLGIMTISSAFAIILGQKLSLRRESVMQNVIGESNKLDMINLVRNVIIVTITLELLGAVILYFTFISKSYSVNQAIYHSIFHSISAFCNAGFCLYSDSLIKYLDNFNINFVITSLIILGGIGFPVMKDIQRTIKNKFRFKRLSLHSKIVLSATFFLLLAGTLAFFISEYNNEMKGFSFFDRLFASYFQSVTTRTAGFNTIDTANLSKGSSFVSGILMFIGASPGSTGGGVKTTALVVVFISFVTMFRGHKDVNIFKRKVSENIIKKVMALVAASIAFLAFMIFLLLLFEPFTLEKTIFEAVSAFGTVGLSMGITAKLSEAGQIIIVLLMYLGRVGPLTLMFAISQTKDRSSFTYTEEKISIG